MIAVDFESTGLVSVDFRHVVTIQVGRAVRPVMSLNRVDASLRDAGDSGLGAVDSKSTAIINCPDGTADTTLPFPSSRGIRGSGLRGR